MGDGVSNERVIAFGKLSGVHFARLVLVPPVDPRRRLDADPDERRRRGGGRPPGRARRAAGRGHGRGVQRTAAGIRRCRRAPPAGSPSCAPGRCAPTRATSTGRDARSPRCATRPGCATRSRPTSTRPAPALEAARPWTRGRRCRPSSRTTRRSPSPPRLRRSRSWASACAPRCDLPAAAATLLVLSPLLVVAAGPWIVLLRIHERHDPAPNIRPDPAAVALIAGLEDHLAQNSFTAVGRVKPGPFRRLTSTALLWVADWATPHLFAHADLAGVKTIHFARWVFLDGKSRLVFASNYDGSLETLHGRLHRQGGVGPERDLLKRRRLSAHELALLRRRLGRGGVQALHPHASAAGARLVLGVRKPDEREHRAKRSRSGPACTAR